MAEGIRLAHPTIRNDLFVVENAAHRFTDGGYDCNICPGVHHYGKTTHLWMEPDGTCLVSKGVLEELRRAGMPQLTVVGSTKTPPTLTVGMHTRTQLDNQNRRMFLPHRIPQLITMNGGPRNG